MKFQKNTNCGIVKDGWMGALLSAICHRKLTYCCQQYVAENSFPPSLILLFWINFVTLSKFYCVITDDAISNFVSTVKHSVNLTCHLNIK